MTTRPHLKIGSHLWRGTAAVLLFGVMTATFLGTDLGTPAGFPDVENITAVIGYAMFDIPAESVAATGTEPFLVTFILIAFVLDAALEGSLLLARREERGEIVSALKEWGED